MKKKKKKKEEEEEEKRKIEENTAGVGEFESSKADVVESFIVEDHALVGIFNKLMNRESSIIGFNNSIRHLRRRENRES